mmetsp:Transcript_48179/g.139603  ORF Transcript_48179/g.139603 Transcript_48179/m.139603 type:complete len:236 (+) Transcript_48179:313-1020(+)
MAVWSKRLTWSCYHFQRMPQGPAKCVRGARVFVRREGVAHAAKSGQKRTRCPLCQMVGCQISGSCAGLPSPEPMPRGGISRQNSPRSCAGTSPSASAMPTARLRSSRKRRSKRRQPKVPAPASCASFTQWRSTTTHSCARCVRPGRAAVMAGWPSAMCQTRASLPSASHTPARRSTRTCGRRCDRCGTLWPSTTRRSLAFSSWEATTCSSCRRTCATTSLWSAQLPASSTSWAGA